jgi:transposase
VTRDPVWLTHEQMDRPRLFFPKSHRTPRVDDRRVLSGITFIQPQWAALAAYGPLKTLYNPWKRCGEAAVFARKMEGSAAADAGPDTVMIDATYFETYRTASSLWVETGPGRLIARTEGGMNMKLHAIADANGCPLRFFMTAGQISDYTGAAALLDDRPKAQ